MGIWIVHQPGYHTPLPIHYFSTFKRGLTDTNNASQSFTVSISVIHKRRRGIIHRIKETWVHISAVPFEKLCDFEKGTQLPEGTYREMQQLRSAYLKQKLLEPLSGRNI